VKKPGLWGSNGALQGLNERRVSPLMNSQGGLLRHPY
jgi:hypothetical protein